MLYAGRDVWVPEGCYTFGKGALGPSMDLSL